MKVIRYPKREEWPAMLRRPESDTANVENAVREIVSSVRQKGDPALRAYTREFDGADLAAFAVTAEEFAVAETRISPELADAIKQAHSNIEQFHSAQREPVRIIETAPGVTCWRRSVPIERVGLYVPAGTAPLFSTALMLGVPARLAGCREIVICTPPMPDGSADDAILYTAKVCGISTVFKIGGSQAIAAMAYGTESVPKVDKIFGPGNSWVTCAKQIVSMDVAIDMPAGPSEVAILADRSCDPVFVAADLLSQAEHGPDSQTILVTNDPTVIDGIISQIQKQIVSLPRRSVADAAIRNSSAFLVDDLETGIDLLNVYAAEHLILAVQDSERFAEKVTNAGSVFLGNYSCESLGDYASGTNHTLPTAGSARAYSGISLDSFVKKITFQKVDEAGIKSIGPAVQVMAGAEGLEAHRRAVTFRLEALDGI